MSVLSEEIRSFMFPFQTDVQISRCFGYGTARFQGAFVGHIQQGLYHGILLRVRRAGIVVIQSLGHFFVE